MSYDPFKKAEHTKNQCEQFFGPKSTGKAAQTLHKENPELYRAVRQSAEKHGLLGKASYTTPEAVAALPMSKGARTFSVREIELRQKYSEAEIKELYRAPSVGSLNNLGEIRKTDPAKYQEIREAAVSYGLIDPLPAPAPKQTRFIDPDEGKFELSADLCQKMNLPTGTKVDSGTFQQIMVMVSQPKDGH